MDREMEQTPRLWGPAAPVHEGVEFFYGKQTEKSPASRVPFHDDRAGRRDLAHPARGRHVSHGPSDQHHLFSAAGALVFPSVCDAHRHHPDGGDGDPAACPDGGCVRSGAFGDLIPGQRGKDHRRLPG